MYTIEYNKDLYSSNTMKVHSKAEMYSQPENITDLMGLVSDLADKGIPYRLIGGGSNIVLPKQVKGCVISTMMMNNNISIEGNKVVCGASVRLQRFIRSLQDAGLGGIEYLYSVPASVGGAVFMNAGRGNKEDSIGNYIDTVTYYDPKSFNVYEISKEQCGFGYRDSSFKEAARCGGGGG